MKLFLQKAILKLQVYSLILFMFMPAHANSNHVIENALNSMVMAHTPYLLKSEFGTDTKVTVVGSTDFDSQTGIIQRLGFGNVCLPGPDCVILAQVDLPDSVSIMGWELNYLDTNPGMNITCILLAFPHSFMQTLTGQIQLAGFISAGVPGAASSGVIAPLEAHVVDNRTYQYLVVCDQKLDTGVSTVQIYWKRAISPEPGMASFNDVPPSHPFYQAIEAMVASGVTGGCGGGNYCPDALLTRGQMAAFMARALGL